VRTARPTARRLARATRPLVCLGQRGALRPLFRNESHEHVKLRLVHKVELNHAGQPPRHLRRGRLTLAGANPCGPACG